MTRKIAVLAGGVALALSLAAPANALTVTFDPTGAGGGFQIDLFDPAPGNALNILPVVAPTAPVGTPLTFLFQANLSVAKLGNAIVYTNGGGGNFFTIVAAKTEVVTSNSGGAFPTETFGFGSGGPNVFRIYRHTVVGDDLSGTCFVTDCAGATLIMEGVFLNNSGFFGAFTANLADVGNALDRFGVNNYPAVLSTSGTGGFNAQIQVTSVAAGYFPTLAVGTTLVFAQSQQNLPFFNANPAACFSSNAIAACDSLGASSVGAVNGLGNRVMLESDANLSFQQAIVPEPATLSLLGLGLLGSVRAFRRRTNKA